jgi:antitoxin CcdA
MRIGVIVKPERHKRPATTVLSKRATNISLAMDVYLDAKNLNFNLSQVCEQRLRAAIKAKKERQWNQQHADFLTAFNSMVEEEGVALQECR